MTGRYRWQIHLGLVIVATLAMAGCQPDPPAKEVSEANPAAEVVAVCYPLQYLAQRICGTTLEVACPVPAGEDASQWKPERNDISRLQTARLIIANGRGAEYAKWLDKVSIPESKLCLTATRGLKLAEYIAVEDIRYVHSHGPEGEHSHPTMVAYTWLDPAMARKQADYAANQLKQAFPQHASIFEEQQATLSEDLESLSNLLQKSAANQTATVVTVNPKFKFLTRAAGIADRHLAWFEAPKTGQAREDLEKVLNVDTNDSGQSAARVLITEFDLPDEVVQLVKEKGLKIIQLDPLDRAPTNGNYLDVMRRNIETLNSAVSLNSLSTGS